MRVDRRVDHHELDAGVDCRLEWEQSRLDLRLRGVDRDLTVVGVAAGEAEPGEVLRRCRNAVLLQATDEGLTHLRVPLPITRERARAEEVVGRARRIDDRPEVDGDA